MLEKLCVCFPHQQVIRFVLRAAAVSKSAVPGNIPSWHWGAAAMALSPSSSGWPHPNCLQERLQVWGEKREVLGSAPQWSQTQHCQGHCKKLAEFKPICVGTGCVCCRYNHTSYLENLPYPFFSLLFVIPAGQKVELVKHCSV